MTYDQIISTAMTRLGNRPGLRTSIEAELELIVQNTLEKDPRFKPWFLLYEDLQNIATVGAQAYVDPPADFLWEYDDGFLFYNSAGALSPIRKNSYEVLETRHQGATATQPVNYAMVGQRIFLFPIPTGIVTLKTRYYRTSGTINNSNLWVVHAPDLLIAEVTKIMALNAQNVEMVAAASAMAKSARERIFTEGLERSLMNLDERMGDGP